ncbi:MAG: hypothetical protein GX259_07810 [Bacteroidales bacterium]|nr:hypothetical protein [Bacteroidales bacterium]
MRYLKFVFLLLPVFFVACKEELAPPPAISVISPAKNTSANVGDTLKLRVLATSEIKIKYVKIVLLNKNYMQECPVQMYYPESTKFDLSGEYVISNEYLETGSYFLYFEVANDDAVSKAYVPLNLTETNKTTKVVFVFCNNKNANYVNIYKIDSSFSVNLFRNLAGDFSNGAVNSRNKIVYSAGRFKGNLFFLDAEHNEILKQINVPTNLPFPYFEIIYFNNKRFIVGYSDSRIEGYFGDGTLKFSYLFKDYRLYKVCYDGVYLTCVMKHFTGQSTFIYVVYEDFGTVKGNFFINYDVVNLFSIEENKNILFCNNGNQPEIRVLDIYNMIITKIKDLPLGKIFCVEQISSSSFVFSHSDGIFLYNFENNSVAELIAADTASHIAFDNVNKFLFLSNAKTLKVVSFPALGIVNTFEMPDTIKDIKILYNK